MFAEPSNDPDRIDQKTREALRLVYDRGSEALSARLESLEREWPLDRPLMIGIGSFVLTGLLLGRLVNRRLHTMSAVAGAFLLLYAFSGWAPPVIMLRRLGFRTREEINRERMALKSLRGDFDRVSEGEPDAGTKVGRAVEAAA